MAKFADLIFIAVAFQAVFAGSGNWEFQRRQADEMKDKMTEMVPDVVGFIQETDTESSTGRRFMVLAANDFTYALEKVFYRIQQVAQTMEGNKKRDLQEMASSISDMAHAIQQAMNSEPTQMKALMKTNMEKVPETAKKLSRFIQQSQEDRRNSNNEIKQAMSTLMTALQKMKLQMTFRTKTVQEMNRKMEELIDQMPMYFQNLSSKDEQTAKDLTYLAMMFCRKMLLMVSRVEKFAFNKEGDTKLTLQQVANRMIEKCAELEQAANSLADSQEKITRMKDMLMPFMRDMATQMQRMVRVAQANSQDQEMDALVKFVMMDAMAACKNMQLMLRMIALNN